jgi:hypothetical protein
MHIGKTTTPTTRELGRLLTNGRCDDARVKAGLHAKYAIHVDVAQLGRIIYARGFPGWTYSIPQCTSGCLYEREQGWMGGCENTYSVDILLILEHERGK